MHRTTHGHQNPTLNLSLAPPYPSPGQAPAALKPLTHTHTHARLVCPQHRVSQPLGLAPPCLALPTHPRPPPPPPDAVQSPVSTAIDFSALTAVCGQSFLSSHFESPEPAGGAPCRPCAVHMCCHARTHPMHAGCTLGIRACVGVGVGVARGGGHGSACCVRCHVKECTNRIHIKTHV